MSHFFVLYQADGTLAQVNQCDDPTWAAMAQITNPVPNLTVLEISDIPADKLGYLASNYVAGGAVTARQTMSPNVTKDTLTADGIDRVSITGLPTCKIAIAGPLTQAATDITDGTVDFTANIRGDYVITATAPPQFLDWSTTLHAV
jgi:hypothetical protein